ncbi:hypothetical protein DB30_05831 [Enhygromyxa salina]|uniref:Lipoprotein n=1 Tax=Enhygromyxa salina TaxID=215803 RepID=A0A0C2CVM1_9BACT|nr:hypothetical protein [Enhygromyxa salina]KIG15131.1 hypothetical protein DB30_05831 [Enhygromyxa salina]
MRGGLRSTSIVLGALVLIASSLGCTEPIETIYVNEGVACVSVENGTDYIVTVDFPVCLSSSCDTLVKSSCDVQILFDAAGPEPRKHLLIHARATVRSESGSCTADCGLVQEVCELNVSDGDYTLVFGDHEGILTVPAVPGDEPLCLGG